MGLRDNLSPLKVQATLHKLQKLGDKLKKKKKKLVPRVVEDTFARTVARSLGGFALGMTLASIYGAMVVLSQGYNIWYCLLSTITLALSLGFGMAFSRKVRITVLLMLPQMFSKEGKTMLLLLAFSLAMEGPFTNIIRNFTRSAETVSCGAELALNQTAEMIERVRQPLRVALQKIKDIAQKAKVVADRVRKLFRSVMDSVRHIAHCLRNIWYWLLHLGDICNEEMGSPYRKCSRIFDDAKDRCERAVPALYFLCHIVLLFKYLCGLANILLVFCIIPRYIVPFLRRKVAEPIVAVLNRIRKEFEFNITTVNKYEVTVNASKSLSQVAFDIMEDVSTRLQPAREAIGLFGYMSALLILFLYVRALLYRKRYLRVDSFDNVYITRPFLEMDAQRRKLKRPTVLPLSWKESTKYIRPTHVWCHFRLRRHFWGIIMGLAPGFMIIASLVLPRKEQLHYALAIVSISRQIILATLLILADYSVFWLFDLVRYHLHGEVVARAPVKMSINVNGTGYTSEIYRDMVSAFNVLQTGNVSVLSQRCRLHPSEPDYNGYLVIGMMYGTCFFIAVFGTYVQRLRRVVCASYYPSRERERVCYLYNTILTRRKTLVAAVLKAVRQRSADGSRTNILLILASKSRLCAWLVKKLGIHEAYCMGCGLIRKSDDSEDFVTCSTPGCRGIYCSDCYKLLNDTCSICMAPLTYQGDMDEEMDSSDEETLEMWTSAVRALRRLPGRKRQELRQLLTSRIERAVKGKGDCRRLPPEIAKKILKQLKEYEDDEDEDSTVYESTYSSPGESSEEEDESSLDFSYQKRSEGSDSDNGSSQELKEVKTEKNAK